MSRAGKRLIQAAKEAAAIARGESTPDQCSIRLCLDKFGSVSVWRGCVLNSARSTPISRTLSTNAGLGTFWRATMAWLRLPQRTVNLFGATTGGVRLDSDGVTDAKGTTGPEAPSRRDRGCRHDRQDCDRRDYGRTEAQVGPHPERQGGGTRACQISVNRGALADRQEGGAGQVGIMPNHSARAIANEFLRRRASAAWPQQLVLQKLTYIAHGWNLAINKEPLITEAAEAWDNGPVFRSIWDHIKSFGYRGPNCELSNPETGEPILEQLSPQETAIIDHVWKKYGTMSAKQLSEATHRPDTPWYKAYFGRYRNAPLLDDDIRSHYIKLAMAGRGK